MQGPEGGAAEDRRRQRYPVAGSRMDTRHRSRRQACLLHRHRSAAGSAVIFFAEKAPCNAIPVLKSVKSAVWDGF